MNNKWKNTADGYGWLSILLHWLMVIVIVAAYAMMDLKTLYPKGSSSRDTMAIWHYTLGLLVFGLVWVRLLARLPGSSPVVRPAMPASQALVAKGMQLALYALMTALPLLGWLTLSARGTPVSIGGLELPALLAKNKDTAKLLKEIHEAIATAGYFLIGLHAAAALFHHYVKRDNTLRLMLPRRKQGD